jgi:hypothetical protein
MAQQAAAAMGQRWAELVNCTLEAVERHHFPSKHDGRLLLFAATEE